MINAIYAPGTLVVGSAEGERMDYMGRSDDYRTTHSLYAPESPHLAAPKDTIVRVSVVHETSVARVLIERNHTNDIEAQYFDAADPRLSCLYFGVAGLYRSISGSQQEGADELEAKWQYATDDAAVTRLEVAFEEAIQQAEATVRESFGDK